MLLVSDALAVAVFMTYSRSFALSSRIALVFPIYLASVYGYPVTVILRADAPPVQY